MIIALRDAPMALNACLVTALSAVNQLAERPDMQEHQPTIGGIRATLRWLVQAQPISSDAWHDLNELGHEVRDLYAPTRVGRGGEPNLTANLLCTVDQQLQQAGRIVADALKSEVAP